MTCLRSMSNSSLLLSCHFAAIQFLETVRMQLATLCWWAQNVLVHVSMLRLHTDVVEDLHASKEISMNAAMAVQAPVRDENSADHGHYIAVSATMKSHCCVQANILQPLTHVGTLSLRYDAVEELLASEELLVDVAQGLHALPRDLDRVCRGLVSDASAVCIYPVKIHLAVMQVTKIPGLRKHPAALLCPLREPLVLGAALAVLTRHEGVQSGSVFPERIADAGLALQAMRAAIMGAPKKDPATRIAMLVQSVILLREALTALPGLAQLLQPASAELLKAVGPTQPALTSCKCLCPSSTASAGQTCDS